VRVSARRRLFVWGGVWVAVAGLLGVLEVADVEVIDLFKDTIELRGDERLLPWKGAIGVLGGVAWFVAATCALLAAAVLPPGDGRRRYLAATAGVLALLGLDDALVIHDHLLPYLTGVRRSEKAMLGLLAATVLAWIIRYRHRLAESDLVLLGMSGLGLGGAFGIDVLKSLLALDFQGIALLEEVSELLGLLTLVAWTATEALRALREPDPLG
jgi:hypothetical protein